MIRPASTLFLVLLAMMACTFPQKNTHPTAPDVAVPPATPAAAPIVPSAPSFDAQGALVKVAKSNTEWKQSLNEQEYYVLRQEGTERAFTGDLWNNHLEGMYTCRGCGLPLFESKTKFDSGTGWPSFYQPLDKRYVQENRDASHGMVRTEVECARCGGHLGHVFDDGPRPTGLRYCINSVSLDFVPHP